MGPHSDGGNEPQSRTLSRLGKTPTPKPHSDGGNELQSRTLSRLGNTQTSEPHNIRHLDDGLDEQAAWSGNTQSVDGLQPRTVSRVDETTVFSLDGHDNCDLQPQGMFSVTETRLI